MPSGADWCTLCYADLRSGQAPAATAPVAPAAPPPAPPTPPAAPAPAAVAPAAVAPTAPAPAAVATLAPPEPAPAAAAPEQPAAGTWPCSVCAAAVPIQRDTCGECGAGFLAGDPKTASIHLPVVGNLASANVGVRYTVGLIAGGVLALIFLLLLFLLGKVF